MIIVFMDLHIYLFKKIIFCFLSLFSMLKHAKTPQSVPEKSQKIVSFRRIEGNSVAQVAGRIRGTFKSCSDPVKTWKRARPLPPFVGEPCKDPAVKGHAGKVVFKELIKKLQYTSGAFKISQIKCLRLSCAPLCERRTPLPTLLLHFFSTSLVSCSFKET